MGCEAQLDWKYLFTPSFCQPLTPGNRSDRLVLLWDKGRYLYARLQVSVCSPPLPPIDTIWAMMIVWRTRGDYRTARAVLEAIIAFSAMHTLLWAAPTGQTDLSLSHWVHFTVLRCICVFVFSCISLHACCIIVTRWGGPGGIEAWSDDWPSSFSA